MMETNYRYSADLLEYCLHERVPLIYASSAAVYGASTTFKEGDPAAERPLNVYGYSKLLFDQYVRPRVPSARSQVVGLRYFNVYGPHEAHKGPMASVAYHLNRQMIEQSRGAAIRRQRWLCCRRAAPRFRARRRRCARESVVLRAPPSVRHLQRGDRQERELQRSRHGDHRLARRRQDSLHPVSGSIEGELPELHASGHRRAARRGLRLARSSR